MTAGPVVEIDVLRLWEAVSYRLFKTSKTARQVAGRLGFSPQVFSDLKASAQGRNSRKNRGPRLYVPGTAAYLSICWWLGEDPRKFQRLRPGVQSEETDPGVLAGDPS